MKFTLSWLKDHLETNASLKEITDRMTSIGFEVEQVNDKSNLKSFIIAKIISATQHPNAEKLKILNVDIGSDSSIQVVCGASNAREGLISVFAPPGAYVPGLGIQLSVAKIRGVESFGMMCSQKELNLSGEDAGIMELPSHAPIGESFSNWFGLSDPVIDFNLTPNRSDAAGIYGLARDLAAAGLGRLKTLEKLNLKRSCPCLVKVHVDKTVSETLCQGFSLSLIRGVKNGSSPEWLKRRLLDIGLNPINALVDITNYITFNYGRPLHVFDARKIKGDLIVRFARDSEKFFALDQREYILSSDMCVIADEKGPVSLAGIIGGQESGCDEETVDVLIESALWEPFNIARTGRKLGLVTDARYRFERGVDPEFMIPGLDIATSMIQEICGGESSEIECTKETKFSPLSIFFPFKEVRRVSGLDLSKNDIVKILLDLGFECEDCGDAMNLKVPSWRHDIKNKVDIVEEVIRIHGLDKIVSCPLETIEPSCSSSALSVSWERRQIARRALALRGMREAISWSFISQKQAELFGPLHPSLEIANPVSREMSYLRPSLLPGLILAAGRNVDSGFSDLALFEISSVYQADDCSIEQFLFCSAIRQGTDRMGQRRRIWSRQTKPVSVFDAKQDALAVLEAYGFSCDKVQVKPEGSAFWHPGRVGTLMLAGKAVGVFGAVHPDVLDSLKVSGALIGFEIFLDALPLHHKKKTQTKEKLELSCLQPVKRDFAFIADKKVLASDLINAVRTADRKLVVGVTVFDVFEGGSIEPDKKSLGIEVTIQPFEKTLVEEDLESLSSRIIESVKKKTGSVLRS